MNFVRFSTLAAALALAACAPGWEGTYSMYRLDCASTAAGASDAEWKQAKTVDISIKDGAFTPRSVYLRVGKPAVIRIANKDAVNRNIADTQGFLTQSQVPRVTIGGADHTKPCIGGLRIAAGSTAELRVVPNAQGSYQLQDSHLVFPALVAEYFARELNPGGDAFIVVRP